MVASQCWAVLMLVLMLLLARVLVLVLVLVLKLALVRCCISGVALGRGQPQGNVQCTPVHVHVFVPIVPYGTHVCHVLGLVRCRPTTRYNISYTLGGSPTKPRGAVRSGPAKSTGKRKHEADRVG